MIKKPDSTAPDRGATAANNKDATTGPGRREALGMISLGALSLAHGLLDSRAARAQSGTMQMGTTKVMPIAQSFQVKAKHIALQPGQPQANQNVTVRFTIETSGSGTKSVPWKIMRGSTVLGQGTRNNVVAGTAFEQTATWPAQPGTHNFTGQVDPANTLNEPTALRGDNTISISVSVPQPTNWPVWGAAAWNGTRQGIHVWQQQARLTGVKIAGPSAIGGRVTGPSIQGSVKAAMVGAGAPNDTATRFADAVAEAWKLWHEGVTVPGLPWYPAFAAFPGPKAPPMPNVPTPLAALPSSRVVELSVNGLKNRIRAKLGTLVNQPGASAAIDQFVGTFTGRFGVWAATLQVINVRGQGPVPSFAPPMIPVGPVVGGSVLELPGSFLSPAF